MTTFMPNLPVFLCIIANYSMFTLTWHLPNLTNWINKCYSSLIASRAHVNFHTEWCLLFFQTMQLQVHHVYSE